MKTFRITATAVACTAVATSAQAQWSTAELPAPRASLAATTLGDLAMFAGGDLVDIYDATMGHPTDPGAWSTATLSAPRFGIGATSVGNYALFAGGDWDSGVVDVYDAVTSTWGRTTLLQARGLIAATTVGTLALFGDGSVVEIYDASVGPPTDPGAWRVDPVHGGGVATAVGVYALFAGDDDVIHAYDSSTDTWLAHSTGYPPDIQPQVATSVGDKAMFAGWPCSGGFVLTYDSSLGPPSDPQTWVVDDSHSAWPGSSATSLGGRALFAGGNGYDCGCSDCGVGSSAVGIYFDGSSQWGGAQLSAYRTGISATTVDNKAIFAGGWYCLPGSSCGGLPGACCWPVTRIDIYEQNNFCAANTNSTGLAAMMTVGGTASIAQNEFSLRAEPVPGEFFVFFHGPEQQEVPFGNGFLCLGGGLTRIASPAVAVEHVAALTVDLPSNGITAPGTLHFQCWYRDPSAGGALFNTSDAISVAFAP